MPVLPLFEALFAVIVWGASFIATKVALQVVSPAAVVWLRFSMGVGILGVAVALSVLSSNSCKVVFNISLYLSISVSKSSALANEIASGDKSNSINSGFSRRKTFLTVCTLRIVFPVSPLNTSKTTPCHARIFITSPIFGDDTIILLSPRPIRLPLLGYLYENHIYPKHSLRSNGHLSHA